jgi:hypothetical protein
MSTETPQGVTKHKITWGQFFLKHNHTQKDDFKSKSMHTQQQNRRLLLNGKTHTPHKWQLGATCPLISTTCATGQNRKKKTSHTHTHTNCNLFKIYTKSNTDSTMLSSNIPMSNKYIILIISSQKTRIIWNILKDSPFFFTKCCCLQKKLKISTF